MSVDWGLFRIDDRLLHGQIMTVWVAELQVNHILIIDDVLSRDVFLQNVYRYSAPPGITIEISPVDKSESFISKYNSFSSVMVIVRSPEIAAKLFKRGFPLQSVNIGTLGSTPERERYYQNIFLSIQELGLLNDLQNNGIRIYFQRVPNEPQKSFESTLI